MQDDQSDSTTWRYMPFLWSATGDLLNSDNTEAIFNGPEGVKALTLLQQMSTEDKSVYLDSGDGSKSLGLLPPATSRCTTTDPGTSRRCGTAGWTTASPSSRGTK